MKNNNQKLLPLPRIFIACDIGSGNDYSVVYKIINGKIRIISTNHLKK